MHRCTLLHLSLFNKGASLKSVIFDLSSELPWEEASSSIFLEGDLVFTGGSLALLK